MSLRKDANHEYALLLDESSAVFAELEPFLSLMELELRAHAGQLAAGSLFRWTS